ncbi:electron transfer flavoprotein subunit alpha/FixB family protein [Desulfolutivibrio sulfoxidireducens]|uniref:electron transfer flavoprotein subunit alpha/FixB family protein n=1 Tax=Desulfolutivibrio sulfoxidireducens TaxID=2773299 RepID=UPI00159DB798|nr:electron transfer flavoprotein subunit alpha [Desulfolutivibrio sulfoxidireducens]QLA17908.1 electron transfer flavoprotein subunit alpha [Desulfolutivibrio sulfoxidireducens]
MEKILFLAHTETDGGLSKASLEALTAAKTLAGELGCGFGAALFGADVADAANALAGCGATAMYGAAGQAFGQARYATDAAAITALCQAVGATIVVCADDSRLSRAVPGAAHRLGGRVDAHVTALAARDGKAFLVRWYYRQRMSAEMTREQRPWFVTVSGGVFEAHAVTPGQAALTAVDVPDATSRTTVKDIIAPAADEQTIRPDAALLFVAGAGWTKKQADGQPHVAEAGEIILGFTAKAQASLGSSKSLVDMGGEGQAILPFLSHLHQVGQTGATPRHPKGLATCCHGEEPHVVGWRFIGERRAVNLDAGCGWAQGKCDVLYVADAFAVMRAVNEMLG